MKSPLVQPDINGNPVKYLVYSAHDTTLSAALIAMEAWDDVQPYYASGKNFGVFLRRQFLFIIL